MEKRETYARRRRGHGVLTAALRFLVQWVVPIVLLSIAFLFRHDLLVFLRERMPYVF
jgi:hypothetical protein